MPTLSDPLRNHPRTNLLSYFARVRAACAMVLLAVTGAMLFTGPRAVNALDDCSPNPDWVVATVPVGDQPASIAVNPTSGRVYVMNRGSGTVTVLDAMTLAPSMTWEVGPDPIAFAVSSQDPSVYLVRHQDAQSIVLALDGQTGAVKTSKTLDIVAADLAVHPAGRRVYVVGWDGGHITGSESSNGALVAVDGLTGQTTALRLLGGLFFRYRSVAVEPVGGQIFVTWTQRYGRNGLQVFDGLNLDRLGGLSPSADNQFTGLTIDATGRRLLLSTTWQWVEAVDLDLPIRRQSDPTAGDLLLGHVDVGRPGPSVYDEATKLLYVTRWPLSDTDDSAKELLVVDTRSYRVLGSLPVGAGRHSMALDTATHRVFVTNQADGTLTVIQGILPEAGC